MKLKKRSIFAALFVLSGIAFTGTRLVVPAAAKESSPKLIVVHANRFSFSPAEITLKKGEEVKLQMISDDVPHSLLIRGIGVNLKNPKPNEMAEISVTPEQIGDFRGTCGIFCGSGHGTMSLTVHVIE
jgi:cytochrome c oxidase subunit 2